VKPSINGHSVRLHCLAAIAFLAGDAALLKAEVPSSAGTAALSHLRSDQVDQALVVLGEAVDEHPQLSEVDSADLAAAGGGLFRALSQRSTDEQYDLLHAWSVPGEERPAVRILTTPVPQHVPPVEFVRLLGERPRETVFPIAEVGGVRGLFCSGWMLVKSADDIGRLSRLTSELETLAAQGTPNADTLLLLARIADSRGDVQSVGDQLKSRTNALEEQTGAGASAGTFALDPNALALAAAALDREPLRPLAEDLLRALLESTYGRPAERLRAFLRVAHATAVQRHRGESGPETLYANRLKYWVPATGMTSAQHAAGGVEAMWLVHEDHVLHLAGTGNDVLFFRYPLTGDFTFTCQTQEGGEIGTDGGLVYGGLQFEALGRNDQLTVADADSAHQVTRLCPFVRHEDRPTFNRVSIRSNDDGAQFLANLHPVWFDTEAARRSPWLGLRSFGDRRPVFRNFELTGEPVIPREVSLTGPDGSLRGWRSQIFGQTQPPFSTDGVDGNQSETDYEWRLNAGVLQAERQDLPAGQNAQGLICYQRPLLDGEAISYEFQHVPGAVAVHPALGRLAFLIEPGGVRIHWITDGDREWTGLSADNATLEPLNRRGPAELPLQEDGWNKMTIARQEGRVTLTLNEELIYERPVDYSGDHLFGLYHDRSASAVRVRKVVMTGDWPESLPEEFLKNPAAVTRLPAAPDDRQVLSDSVGAEFLAENVRQVCRRAERLQPEERYEFLCNWMLPGASHAEIRLAAEFAQADQRPGAKLVSPVFDLLDVAAQLGRLEELRGRIAEHPPPATASQQRALSGISALLAMESGDVGAAENAIAELTAQVADVVPETIHDQWPETLVVVRLIEQHDAIDLVGDLLLLLYNQRVYQLVPRDCDQWHTHIAAYVARYRNAALDRTFTRIDPVSEGEWVPAARQRFASRGRGNAPAVWARTADDELVHLSGHQEELLLYRSPLRGDFEIECDIASHQTQMLAAGQFCGPDGAGKTVQIGTFQKGIQLREPITPPLSKVDPWVRYRAVFRDGVCTVFVSGRQVARIPLPEGYSPWIGARCWWRSLAHLRDVRISGNPEVPESVMLSGANDFANWLPYFNESIGYEGARWQVGADPQAGDQIVGRRIPQLAGTYAESLLRYLRPLVEDGSITYEFFYQPGQAITHPALDRLAFLLDPDGVRVHWITDGPADPTEIDPDNAIDEPENRLGPTPLPLSAGTWNQLQLSSRGETVTLQLNGIPIYERVLESTNQRTFGLFRYADTEVRVRNVVMRGDWPREIPPVTEQSLANSLVAKLNTERDQLEDAFSHDFGSGLEPRYFNIHNRDSQGVSLVPGRGIGTEVASSGKWTQVAIVPRFTLHGDYDIEARFDRAEFGGDTSEGHIQLLTRLDDPLTREARMARGRQFNGRQYCKGQLSIGHPDGTRHYIDTVVSHHSTSGRLRLARRDETVYFLYAENDSSQFQLVGQEPVSEDSTTDQGIRLLAVANKGGRTRANFQEITLRAERLTLAPPPDHPPTRPLFVMSPDGSNLRQVTLPLEGFTHQGSPEWLPDSQRIALDMSRGSTRNSHVVVVHLDGSDPQDLGPGCMPSFSADAGQFVMSESGQGVIIMDADGTNRRVLDRRGWGAQWSPDGRWIAYGRSGNIVIPRPDTGETREILQGEEAQRYSYIYWNLGWSRDSQAIAFKGRNRETGQDEAALVEIDAPDRFRVLYATDESIQADFTFSPGDQQVLFSKHSKVHRGPALFVVAADGSKPPKLLLGQPSDVTIYNCDWSPDGKLIAFSGQLPPEQLEWPLTAAADAGSRRE